MSYDRTYIQTDIQTEITTQYLITLIQLYTGLTARLRF